MYGYNVVQLTCATIPVIEQFDKCLMTNVNKGDKHGVKYND